jgi:putative serine protease PepD
MMSGPAGDQARAPVLVVRLGRQQHVFPVGMQIRVGRDPTLELVSVNPLVSRDTHGLITSDEKGAVYTDRSRRGTFLDGKRLNGPLRITESVILRLGDPATGEELGITPPLSSAELELNRERRVRRGRVRLAAIAVGAVAVAGGIAAGAFALTGSPAPSGKQTVSTIPSVSALARPEAATVRLLQGSQSSYTGWGSGTVIAPDGLILTNAHVAEPQAPGLAVALGEPESQLEPNPPYLTVELTTGPASPVNPATLRLPYLTIGNDAAVQLDQTVTVLGFPGVADSDSITVTSGVISTFVPDPLGHVTDPRFELETTARLAHGNSGGAAVNDAGQLIGVPSLEVTGEGGDLSWRLRSVTEAQALIAKAKAGQPYHSKILVQRTGSEHATGAGVGASQGAACGGGTTVQAATAAVFGADFGGVPAGLDLAMLVELPDGSAVTVPTGGLPQLTATSGSGCFAIQVSAEQLGLVQLPSGTYQIQLYGGPTLAPIGTATAVSVGDRGTAGAQ